MSYRIIEGRRLFAILVAVALAATAWVVFDIGGKAHGASRPTCFGRTATIVGTAGDNEINGTARQDVIVAKAGADEVHGRGGNDFICGNRGNDKLEGGTGNDHLDGGLGHDRLDGEAGADVCRNGEELSNC